MLKYMLYVSRYTCVWADMHEFVYMWFVYIYIYVYIYVCLCVARNELVCACIFACK